MSNSISDLEAQIAQTTDQKQRVDLLIKLIIELGDIDLDRSITLAREAQRLATSDALATNPYKEGLAESLFQLTRLCVRKAEYQDALTQGVKGLTLFKELEQANGQLRIFNLIGFSCARLGNYSDGMYYYMQQLELAIKEGSRGAELSALNGIGIIYANISDHQKAIDHYLKCLEIAREIGASEHILLNNCSYEYNLAGEYEKALEFGLRSLEICEEQNEPLTTILAINRVGEAYMGLGDFDQSLTYFQRALAQVKEDDAMGHIRTLDNLGRLHRKMNESEQALSYLSQALAFAQAGNARQSEYECHETMADIYKQMGDYEAALSHYEKFHTVKQEVFNRQADERFKGLEVSYQIKAVQREAEILRQKNAELQKEVRERKRAEEAARAASKAKSRFLATMTHELRTPMNSIMGFAEVLAYHLDGADKEILEDIRRIHNNGRYLLELINDVLDMAQIESGKLEVYPETISPWLVTQETLDAVPNTPKDGVTFSHSIASDLPDIYVDPLRTKQILLNLISNAFKFTEQGKIQLTVRRNDDVVEFEVKDEGIGITPDQQAILFEAFKQVDVPQNRTLRGTGLGLPIARELAEMHGGTITVNSESGKGSTFTLSVPIATNSEG